MTKYSVDILIVGGGLTGAAFMLALDELGYQCLLVEAKSFNEDIKADFDARSLALSPASIRILNTLNIWPALSPHATPIELIHVSDQNRFGGTRLHGDKTSPLGYVVEMQHINQLLHRLLPKDKIMAPAKLIHLDKEQSLATLSRPDGEYQIRAKLIVAADGTHSATRHLCGLSAISKDYVQSAIVANVGLAHSHQFRAYERFTANGPLALLPMTKQRMSLIWAMPPIEAESMIQMKDSEFIKRLQRAFGYRLGRFIRIGQRSVYPLKQTLMSEPIHWPVVFVGNAAHTLHPVAGQGFNLGLRDVAMLAQLIAEKGINANMLKHYHKVRKSDQKAISQMTDGLIHIFTSHRPVIKIARTLGMIAVDNIPIMKKALAHYARGFAGITPDLVCEIPLKATDNVQQEGIDESNI
ncbi:2-octaprenyl-6-methoxyphenyl hydroxylase [Legionella israelensis]|uniref:2-octaprenyl-6-methoxyphenol hydroxylase n=2 Tax=Legionella israelensis TaxID=454 RepID=A0A0W0V2P7_9GAMM|nr:2-octaprenyl-6-methoxyphenyl hydroxylase [Legionella israelensis]KTD13993.1 2-octaprenyl-6-methoxyphenol hydroxylase [Legionella israelensis]QBS09652.1 2-octaprenyl-6-methoxyphenyl hydroxylase [Legionella israelensis]SCY25736.1 2-octaprenyl-6-methoxyphenol hydroxylase [Legionella israelensis DSM 19235]STX60583.1 2-octaprenyl-6-methoxyphenol hydroxylase [Legionella israelensis]